MRELRGNNRMLTDWDSELLPLEVFDSEEQTDSDAILDYELEVFLHAND